MEKVFQHVASVLQAIHKCEDLKVRVSWIKMATTMGGGNFAEVLAATVERNLVDIKSDPEGPIVTLSTLGLSIVEKIDRMQTETQKTEATDTLASK